MFVCIYIHLNSADTNFKFGFPLITQMIVSVCMCERGDRERGGERDCKMYVDSHQPCLKRRRGLFICMQPMTLFITSIATSAPQLSTTPLWQWLQQLTPSFLIAFTSRDGDSSIQKISRSSHLRKIYELFNVSIKIPIVFLTENNIYW